MSDDRGHLAVATVPSLCGTSSVLVCLRGNNSNRLPVTAKDTARKNFTRESDEIKERFSTLSSVNMSSPAQKVSRNHREMYKAKTPPWKETYRKRCLERLKQSREKLQAKFRKLGDIDTNKMDDDTFINDLMKEELQSMKESMKNPTSQSAEVDNFDMGDLTTDIDNVVSLFEDIQAELKLEEMKLIEEFERYESSLKKEEAILCSAIENLCTDEVICPVCQKSPLLINKSVIFCQCGMRVNTEEDCLTLVHVKHLLEEGMTGHTAVCEGQAIFAVVQDLGSQNLLMSCKSCDWMSIII